MIVVSEDSAFLFITQPDHAHLAGEILSLWRADGLPDNPRRDDLLFAAREHDNGWREADAAPRWNAERGRPHDFITLPAGERIAVWERGVCRFAAARPYASLLIARHALNLFGGRRGEEEWDRLLDFLADFESGLIEQTGVEPETLEEDYRWLDLADQISLAACAQGREPAGRYGVHIVPGDGGIGIAPFPLAGATTFRVACRRVPRRAYRSDADLGGELAAARWEERPVRLVEVSEVSPGR